LGAVANGLSAVQLNATRERKEANDIGIQNRKLQRELTRVNLALDVITKEKLQLTERIDKVSYHRVHVSLRLNVLTM
jgi:hypothetical protein